MQQASLQVLNSPDIPSILIETGYLTNPNDARRLNSAEFRNQMAASIAKGIMDYFYEIPPEGTLVAWQKASGIAPGSYSIKRGDSLSEIAERFRTSVSELKVINNLRSNIIQIGQILMIPSKISFRASEHVIQRGETLSEIAEQYRIRLQSLRTANNLSGDRIMVGLSLIHI